MSLNKDSVLANTNSGLDIYRHFLGHRFTDVGKSFKNPFYQDTKASCYVYKDADRASICSKDFGDPDFMGDCFHFVSQTDGPRLSRQAGLHGDSALHQPGAAPATGGFIPENRAGH
jgi:hypothetical protein